MTMVTVARCGVARYGAPATSITIILVTGPTWEPPEHYRVPDIDHDDDGFHDR
jgi:hypothetical protein